MSQTFNGVIKWFDPNSKGYGFVTPDKPAEVPGLAQGKGIFLHKSEWKGGGYPMEGMRVTFGVANSPKGPRAVDVQPLADVIDDQKPLGRRFRIIRGAGGRWVAQEIVGEAAGEIEITGMTPREWSLDEVKRDIARKIRATLEGKRDACAEASAPGGGASFVIEV